MKQAAEREEQEGFVRGYHDIPSDNELSKMSFVELASELASSEKGSPKFIVFEREIKRHFAKDQAKINRLNIGLGACIGGIFGLVGVALGAYLKDSPSTQQVLPFATKQQMKKNNLGENSPSGRITLGASIAQPAINPSPEQGYAQPSETKPLSLR